MKTVPRVVLIAALLVLSVVAVAPAAAAPLPAQQAQSAQPPQSATILGVHTVQQGERVDCIGRAYQVDPAAIEYVNKIANFHPGDKLKIPAVPWYNIPPGTTCTAQFPVPAGWPPPQPTTILGVHTVQQGEWIYCIARAYKVDPIAVARASGFPPPYGPAHGYGCGYGCGNGGYGKPYGGACGGCGGYYPYFSPWNYVLPGQKLNIPAVPWYNIPAGPICAAQFQLPAGWPPASQYPVPTPY
jgi:hypothetical protein